MTNRMVNVAVLVAVLTVAVLAPSTTYAAAPGTQMVSSENRGAAGIFEMFLRLIGFNPVSAAAKSTPTQPPTPTGGINSPGYSTDTATWGGPGRCYVRC